MLGSQDKPHVNVKAGEARGLIAFAEVLLEECKTDFVGRHKTEGYILLGAVKALNKFNNLIQNSKQNRRVTEQVQFELMDHYSTFIHLIHRIENFPYTPKAHQMYHLIKDLDWNGNPTFYHTYHHETQNMMHARVARSVHRSSWCEAIFRKLHITKMIARNRAAESVPNMHSSVYISNV